MIHKLGSYTESVIGSHFFKSKLKFININDYIEFILVSNKLILSFNA